METNYIKGLHLVDLTKDEVKKLELMAQLDLRYSRITYVIKSITDTEVVVKVQQKKSPQENYADRKRLVEKGHEMFDELFPNKKVIIHPFPFVESPPAEVTIIWISDHMSTTGVRLKDIVQDSGLDNTHLSAVINGTRDLTPPLKAFFFYYFAWKGTKEGRKLLKSEK